MSCYHGTETLSKDRNKILRRVAKRVKQHLAATGKSVDNMLLVGIGVSGVSGASTLAFILKCNWGFFRKGEDANHHGGPYEPISAHGKDVWIVDDFISTGDTVRDLTKRVQNAWHVHSIAGVICTTTHDCTSRAIRDGSIHSSVAPLVITPDSTMEI